MDEFNALIELFRKFPGIGPRQARRFAYFLLGQPQGFLAELTGGIKRLAETTRVCADCEKFFWNRGGDAALCEICRDPSRDQTTLVVVSRDVDLETIEKSRSYRGRYFVLGGSVPILEEKPEEKIRIRALEKHVNELSPLAEIIIAMNITTEGEHTAEFVARSLAPVAKKRGIKISTLGRGLSTGLELEYSDAETLSYALKNRIS